MDILLPRMRIEETLPACHTHMYIDGGFLALEDVLSNRKDVFLYISGGMGSGLTSVVNKKSIRLLAIAVSAIAAFACSGDKLRMHPSLLPPTTHRSPGRTSSFSSLMISDRM